MTSRLALAEGASKEDPSMPGDERQGRVCVICREKAIAPAENEKYCKEHWEERLRLFAEAKDRFTCRRMSRGVDFEHYQVDHENLWQLLRAIYRLEGVREAVSGNCASSSRMPLENESL